MSHVSPFKRHVFLDLETTGLDAATDDVIELGALFVVDGKVEHSVSELFSTGRRLPETIRQLTGLSDTDLRGRPRFRTFLPKLRSLLPGWTLVAHNAGFERAFLAPLFEELKLDVVDSCELLHYLFPELESHALDSVLRWARVGQRAAHRALRDCEDTWKVLDVAFERTVEEDRGHLVRGLVDQLRGDDAPRGLVQLLETLDARCRSAPAPLRLEPSSAFLPARPERTRRAGSTLANRSSDDARRLPVQEQVRSLLGPAGTLETAGRGFVSREGQLGLAVRVSEALAHRQVLAAEAGTGTGKSLGYLTPGMLHAVHNGVRVGVAPHTRALQEQLVAKDLPRLHQATDGAFGYALIKGQENYLCRRKTEQLTQTQRGHSYPERAARAYLRAFARMSPEGDLERVSFWFREHFPALGPLVHAARSEAQTTLGDKCPHYSRCFYHSAVAQAKAADVVVLNHALALRWPARYPKLDSLVLDEAHELEDSITSAFTRELSAGELLGLERRVWALRTEDNAARSETLNDRLLSLRRAREGLGKALLQWALKVRAEGRNGHTELERRHLEGSELALPSPLDAQCTGPGQRELRVALLSLRETLSELQSFFAEETSGAGSQTTAAKTRELTALRARLQEALELVEAPLEKPQSGRILAARFFASQGQTGWALLRQPVDVSALFQKTLVAPYESLVLTSATLSLGPKDAWVLDRLGLRATAAQKPVVFERFASPFRLRDQARVILLTGAPDPQDPAFIGWSAERIAEMASWMGGRVLGLFAATQRLLDVEAKLTPLVAPWGLEVLRQHRASSRLLASRQEADAGSILLGTKAFWQGLDIRGLGVSGVFIDKLPLEPSERPLTVAREKRVSGDDNGYLGFVRYRLPRALLLLRQGVGRLVRSTSDRGVVVIADPGAERYRPLVLAALGDYDVETLSWNEARSHLRTAVRELGLGRKTVLAPANEPATAPALAIASRVSASP